MCGRRRADCHNWYVGLSGWPVRRRSGCLAVGITAVMAMAALTLLARALNGAACAADFTTAYPYAMCCAGLLSLLLLQSRLRAGTLAASQSALTLGDALVGVLPGKTLFDERIALVVRLLPTTLGACLIAAGTVGLSLSPAVAGHWDSTRGNDNATEQVRPQPMADNDGGTECR